MRKGGNGVLTTLRVPMRTGGGFWSSLTIWSMKFEVIPIMVMRHTDCKARTTVNVAPRAPNCGPGILAVGYGIVEIGFGKSVCVWKSRVRAGTKGWN